MENFTLGLTTTMHFGVDCLSALSGELKKHGFSRALIVYGQNSVKKYGTLDKIMANLGDVKGFEFGGVSPNPRVSHANLGIRAAIDNQADVIIAVGGGSVADESKAIAVGASQKVDNIWDVMMGKIALTSALPVIVVMTMPATSSETNTMFVLTNDEDGYKNGKGSELTRPMSCYLDPSFTLTIPVMNTAYAAVDIVSHMIEIYFTAKNAFAPVNLGFIEGLSSAIIDCMDRIMQDPKDLDARASFMWAAAIAFNGLAAAGMKDAVFYAHKLEHPLSGLYDVAHGAGLAVITPAVLTHKKAEMTQRLCRFGKKVFGLAGDNPDATIDAFRAWYKKMGVPSNFAELGIENPDIEGMTKQVLDLGAAFFTKEDVIAMYSMCK